MQCPICNALVPDGTSYCPECGSPLNFTPTGSTPMQPTNNQPYYGMPIPPMNQAFPNQQPMGYGAPMNNIPQNSYQFNQQPGPVASTPVQDKKNSKLPIIIVCALVAVALIIGLILILTKKDDKDKKEPTTTEITTTEATTTEATTTEATTETTTEVTTETTTEATTTEASVDESELVKSGNYVFTGATVDGIFYTKESLEQSSGESYDMTLTITGTTCIVDGSAMGYEPGTYSMFQSGEDLSFISTSESLMGTYDAEANKIIIDVDDVYLEFVNEDADNPVLNGDLNDATYSLHGTYELTGTSYMGQSFTVEEMESMTGETYAMTLTINSGFCLVDASEMGSGQGLATIYVNDDNTVEIDDGGETIYGNYDPETDTLTLTMDGVDMIFEKVE